MNYAASVADPNPRYFADDLDEGIVAPPMIAVALTWAMAARFTDFWEAEDFPAEVLARQVHYSEVLRFQKPMRPGDRLEIVGEVAAIQPHRAGAHLIIRFIARDASGAPVFEEFIGGMLRGVTCVDGPRGDGIPAPLKHPEPPEPLWEKRLHIGLLAAHVYDGCADIHFPIHTSPAFAKSVGLPGAIYHGTATLAQAVRELLAAEAGDDPGRLLEVSCLFTGMVPLNSEIALRVIGREEEAGGARVHFQVLNAEGAKALRRGSVLIGP